MLRVSKMILNTTSLMACGGLVLRNMFCCDVHQASAPASALSGNCHVVGAGRNIFASSGGRKMESDPS